MEGINKIVADTTVMQALKAQTEVHERKLQTMHDHLETQLSGVNSHFDRLFTNLQKAEKDVESRIASIEQRLGYQFEVLEADTKALSGRWVWGFGVVCLVLIGGAGLIMAKYKEFKKTYKWG